MPNKIFIKEYEELNTVRWKTEPCNQKTCWCAIITTEDVIYWHPDVNSNFEDDEVYIAHAGSIPKKIAEHIVDLHNKSLNMDTK